VAGVSGRHLVPWSGSRRNHSRPCSRLTNRSELGVAPRSGGESRPLHGIAKPAWVTPASQPTSAPSVSTAAKTPRAAPPAGMNWMVTAPANARRGARRPPYLGPAEPGPALTQEPAGRNPRTGPRSRRELPQAGSHSKSRAALGDLSSKWVRHRESTWCARVPASVYQNFHAG